MNHWIRRSAICVFALVLSACANVRTINWKDSAQAANYTSVKDGQKMAGVQIEQMQGAWQEADATAQRSRDWTFAGLLFTGVAAVSHGVHADVVRAGALGTGAIYAANNLAPSGPLANIYGDGINATNCALKTVTAFAATHEDADKRQAREKAASDLSDEITELMKAIAAADFSVLSVSDKKLKTTLNAQLAQARTVLKTAVAARDSYVGAASKVDDAGVTLVSTLRDIRTAVNTNLQNQVSDSAAVFKQLPVLYAAMNAAAPAQGFGTAVATAVGSMPKPDVTTTDAAKTQAPATPTDSGTSGEGNQNHGFIAPQVEGPNVSTPGPVTPPPTRRPAPKLAPGALEASQRQTTFIALQEQVGRVGAAVATLDELIPASTTANAPTQLTGCNVNAVSSPALRITAPADGSITVTRPGAGKAAEDSYIHLTGGTPPYRWLKVSTIKGVSLDQINPMDASMTLKVGADAEDTDKPLGLVIQDSAQTPHTATLNVTITTTKK